MLSGYQLGSWKHASRCMGPAPEILQSGKFLGEENGWKGLYTPCEGNWLYLPHSPPASLWGIPLQVSPGTCNRCWRWGFSNPGSSLAKGNKVNGFSCLNSRLILKVLMPGTAREDTILPWPAVLFSAERVVFFWCSQEGPGVSVGSCWAVWAVCCQVRGEGGGYPGIPWTNGFGFP